jgi:hypothetical protein
MLRYLGVPVREKNYMFGYNKSVVDISMGLHAKLHKCHTMLSFHRVGEAITSCIVGVYLIFSKHWGNIQIRECIKSLLFWKGDTADIIAENTTSQAKGE